jgi:hypothetical protein
LKFCDFLREFTGLGRGRCACGVYLTPEDRFNMGKPPYLLAVIVALCLSSSLAAALDQVQAVRQGDRITLANGFLERVLQITNGTLCSVQFTNRLSQRTYTLVGDEFQIDLSFGQLQHDAENPQSISAGDLKVKNLEIADTAQGGRRILVHFEPRQHLSEDTGLEVTAVYELNPNDFYTRQWLESKVVGKGTLFLHAVWPLVNHWSPAPFRGGGLGQPLLGDDVWAGLEYPSSLNTAQHGEVKLGSIVGLNIPPEGFTSEPVVLGVAPLGNAHASFMDYVQRMRMAPARLFVLFNTWYDLQGNVMTAQKVLERIPLLEENLLRKYSLQLDSFVLDDSWDDTGNLWRVDEKRFPGGLHDIVGALDSRHTKLGIWFGPLGGYEPNRIGRLATARRMGMEVTSNQEYLCLAGKNYSAYLRDSMLRLIHDYGVNYFKLDGIPFACSEPDHGHPVGIYSREAYVRAVIDLVKSLHAANPQAFIGLATGPWLSPWWLRYADTVDYGGEDYAYLDIVPSFSARQSAISYNDSVVYHDYAVKHVAFPMSSLDGEGLIKGTYNLLGGKDEPLEDWQDAVVSSVVSGMMRQDLYLTPSLLKPSEWEVLGKSLQYAKANAPALLKNGTWVLGNPAQGEVYGLVHASQAKTLVLLRNPALQPAQVNLPITPENGFITTDQPLKVETIFPFREVLADELHAGGVLRAALDGYEQRIIELRPAAPNITGLEGVRYSVAALYPREAQFTIFGAPGASTRVHLANVRAVQNLEIDGKEVAADAVAGDGTIPVRFGTERSKEPSFSQPSLEITKTDGENEDVRTLLTVDIPPGSPAATFGFLLKLAPSADHVPAELQVNSKPVALATRESSQGRWCWFGTELAPGSNILDFRFHLTAANAAGADFSGWLRLRRKLVARHVVVKLKAGQDPDALVDPLPASSGMERKTYRAFDETL